MAKLSELTAEQIISNLTDEQKEKIKDAISKDDDKQTKLVIDEVLKEVAEVKQNISEINKAFAERKNPVEKEEIYGFKSFGEYAKAIINAGIGKGLDQRLDIMQKQINERRIKAAGDGMQIWDDSEGGFLVPEQFVPQLLRFDPLTINLASRCRLMPMTSPIARIPSIVASSHATSVYGGLIAYFKGEEAALTESKPTFGEVTLQLNKLTIMTYVTDEMLTFSPGMLESYVSPLLQQAIIAKLDQKIINGTGAGEPKGLLNADAIISVSRSVASHIDGEDIINMWARLHPSCQANAVWIVSPAATADLYKASITIGTAGQLVYMPPGGLNTAPYATLLGRPVLVSEWASNLGTTGDIILTDLSQYLLGHNSTFPAGKSDISIHLKFDYAQTAFRVILYVDGQCWWKSALTPANGGDTLSPIVVLN